MSTNRPSAPMVYRKVEEGPLRHWIHHNRVLFREMRETNNWCMDQLGPYDIKWNTGHHLINNGYTSYLGIYRFLEEEDALLFKLTWG